MKNIQWQNLHLQPIAISSKCVLERPNQVQTKDVCLSSCKILFWTFEYTFWWNGKDYYLGIPKCMLVIVALQGYSLICEIKNNNILSLHVPIFPFCLENIWHSMFWRLKPWTNCRPDDETTIDELGMLSQQVENFNDDDISSLLLLRDEEESKLKITSNDKKGVPKYVGTPESNEISLED